MPFMDRVKSGAAQAAQKAQAKIDQVQAKRELDSMFRDLGAAVYAQRTGTGAGDNAAEIERLISAITAHEEQNAPNDDSPTSPTSTLGDSKLDD